MTILIKRNISLEEIKNIHNEGKIEPEKGFIIKNETILDTKLKLKFIDEKGDEWVRTYSTYDEGEITRSPNSIHYIHKILINDEILSVIYIR